ncbi:MULTISPECIES: flavin reductase family protein [unclassified Microbacterium]|uniref:flavin reductase family protein n=1 Tax=unclassified Microbacterium TaxID=2609290 RepID=UPI0025EF3DF9|nr:flavin reductase family protein [uncultured Microbacterium sp.]
MSRLGKYVDDPDPLQMRRSMGRLLSGVSVVTAVDRAGDRHGMTISSLGSISLAPPIVMIALNFDTRTGVALQETGRFAVSILGEKQEAIARRFAVPGGERFEGGEFEEAPCGIPVVAEALVQFECEVHGRDVVGDHEVSFGRVVAARFREGAPLGFLGGRFGAFQDFGHEMLPWSF